MLTEKEIIDLAKDVKQRHNTRLSNQEEDRSYYEDTFTLPLIKDSAYVIRTGAPARLIDGITEQIVTSNPQVFTRPKKDTAVSEVASSRVAKEMNRWARYLNKQNPNPYKQSLKNLLVSGDSWIYVVHNDSLTGNWQEEESDAIPVRFFVYDPLIVFFDPDAGEEYGVPNRIFVEFERTTAEVQYNYPDWKYKGSNKKVKFLMYFDNEVRFLAADEIPLLGGVQENIYKKVPFVHSYSGFGHDSADKDPASLAVSRIHKIKDLYKEDCTMRSDFSFIIHKYAYKHYDIVNRSGQPLSKDALNNYSAAPGTISELRLPPGADFEVSKDLLPDQAVFQYYAMIRSDISAEDSPILHGLPLGSSGRQDDISYRAGMKLYDSVINNTARAWSTAFDMGMQMTTLPNQMPSTLDKGDVDQYCESTLELRSIDPIEAERKSLSGRAQVQSGQLSLKTNFMRFQGMTEDEADDEIAQMMAEAYILKNPEIAMFIGSKVAEKSGMKDELDAYRAQTGESGVPGTLPIGRQIGSKGGEPRMENIQTPQGFEEADIAKTQQGIRRPPV